MRQPLPDRAIVIAGPTASGKSQLALALAQRLGGSIINADSMQVYQELALLTARPGPRELACVPHALYGCVSGQEAYSAGRYARDAAAAVVTARASGRRPVIVGGTGLYLRALLQGLSPVPATDPAVRAYWRQQAAERGAQALFALLAARDPAMASRLKPTDPQRIVRALEVLDSTGRSLADWQCQPGQPVLEASETIPLLLLPPPASHAAAIAARIQRMLGEGALEEVRRLLALGLSPELPIMRALGVAPLSAVLAGRQSLAAGIAATEGATRQYDKRQMTWIRRNMMSWKTYETNGIENVSADMLAFINP